MQSQTIPLGLCQCGCGRRTRIAERNHTKRGHVKGRPVDYLKGHHGRKAPVDYVEEDRGHTTPCWIWQLGVGTKGYGRKRGREAYRVFWEREHGPVPDGLELDHLCRVRLCVNPDHLEPVTHAENMRRARSHRPWKTRHLRKRTKPPKPKGPERVSVLAWDRAEAGVLRPHDCIEHYSKQHIVKEGARSTICGSPIPWLHISPGDSRRCERCFALAAKRGYIDQHGVKFGAS